MIKEAKRAEKIEKKLKVLLTGYQNRSSSLGKQLKETNDSIDLNRIQLETFQRMKSTEEEAIQRRIKVMFFHSIQFNDLLIILYLYSQLMMTS